MKTQSLNFPVAHKHPVCWGQDGLAYYGTFFKAIVIVDVLSFCTTVDIALSKGSYGFYKISCGEMIFFQGGK